LTDMYPRTLTFAAMDTTSAALGRILFLLSIHQDVQNKLRQEITEARKSGDLSYDELVALPYLDAVCRETLRMYAYHPFHYCLNLSGTEIQVSACLSYIQNVKPLHSLLNSLFISEKQHSKGHYSSCVYSHHWSRWSGD